ncbi:PilZ domain-containing protein [Balneatrix alpica]|uniref:PilZ domain-containing protein n=1 Tax=Balneatrix alpica TaxID=75684 RepID=A0ABV5ZFC8_9GAMM|nr:PilZ domain-containing protein [Balneatrix alpica]
MLGPDDRRNFYRMMINADVRLWSSPGAEPLRGKCLDLSATGMGVEVPIPFELGTELEVRLDSTNQAVPPLQAKTKVVRCQAQANLSYHLGLEVVQML